MTISQYFWLTNMTLTKNLGLNRFINQLSIPGISIRSKIKSFDNSIDTY